MLKATSLIAAILFVALSPHKAASADVPKAEGEAYELRGKIVHGVHLGMSLPEARSALIKRGFKRDATPNGQVEGATAAVWEAEYRLPNENTVVSLAYSNLSKHRSVVTRLYLWQQVPRGPEKTWRLELAKRFGFPYTEVNFQGSTIFIWNDRNLKYKEIIFSKQCLVVCVHPSDIVNCQNAKILYQPLMTGGINSNDPKKLYFTVELDDLGLVRESLMNQNAFPRTPDVCPTPVI